MRSDIAKGIREKTSKDTLLYVEKLSDLVLLLKHITRQQGITQSKLAELLDKQPSEISKWFSGEHNLTLKSICKLESILDCTLINIPQGIFQKKAIYLTGKTHAQPLGRSPKESKFDKPTISFKSTVYDKAS